MDELKSSTQTPETTMNQDVIITTEGTETGQEHSTTLLCVTTLPSKEALVMEIQAAIASSPEIKEALDNYQSVVAKRKDMERSLAGLHAKKIELTGEMKKISEQYGDNPDADFKKLGDVTRDLDIVEEARCLLSGRLKPNGETERAEEDARHVVQNAISNALSPISKKYQMLVNRQFDAFVGFLDNYRTAVLSAWPRKTSDGTLLRQDVTAMHNQKLTVHDAESRLALFSDDHGALVRQVLHTIPGTKADRGKSDSSGTVAIHHTHSEHIFNDLTKRTPPAEKRPDPMAHVTVRYPPSRR